MQKKIVNISLLAILLVITFSIPILSVQAYGGYSQERREIINQFKSDEQRIRFWANVYVGDTNYGIWAMTQTQSERKAHEFMRPWSFIVIIDGEEVELSRLTWYDKNGEIFGDGIPLVWTIWYHIYEPNSLEVGEHTIEYIISFHSGVPPVQIVLHWDWGLFWVTEIPP